ncbi:MAG: hypothetical protein L3J43_09125 [Sulfurovum sp.]|nr:hypothetical protein [Sulfurovum sp.]
MKIVKLLAVAATALVLSACIERESKNHPPFEPTTTQSDEQKQALKKLATEAKNNYDAKKSTTTH